MTYRIIKKSTQLVLLFSFVGFAAYAQIIPIKGRITGAGDSLAIPGVKIVEKGTNNVTYTDLKGRYAIDVEPLAVLVFSVRGHETKLILVEKATTIDVSMTKYEYPQSDWPAINVGYGYVTTDRTTGATPELASNDFNQGNIYDPAQLWQGKVAGLSIYKRNGDPNLESLLRIRGLSTFDPDSGPLIVIDGVPMATPHNLDPQDVESITVLKDGASAAIYGMRGSQGVILVTTKKALAGKGLAVTIQGEVAASTLMNKQPVLTAAEHIAAGGNNLGASTDWQDEITRTGMSGNYHLALSGDNGTSSFRIATHIRSVDGILLHSGFDQVNTRVNVRHAAVDGRLRFDLNLAVNNRTNSFSFPLAFRYANLFLPSAPIYTTNGDYYQAIVFDNYNPVAMLEQNINQGKRRNVNYNVKVAFDILKNLSVTVNAGQQFENNFNGRYYSRNSFYVGMQRGGLAQRYTDDWNSTFAEGYLTYSMQTGKIGLDVVGGFQYQQDQSESFSAELGNFPNDELGYNAMSISGDILSGSPSNIQIASTTSPINTIQAVFLRASMTINRAFSFNVSVRQEKSNKLGANQQSGLFPAASVSADLLRYFHIKSLSMLKARVGYGVTGSIPSKAGLSLELYQYAFYGGGTITKVRNANPDLKWEEKKEINVGIDFSGDRFSGSIDYYSRTISDLIQQRYVDSQFGYANNAGLKGEGLEVTVGYYFGNSGGLTWQPSLVVSTNKTIVDYYPVQQDMRAYVDASGCFCSTLLIKTAVGQKPGDIWGPVFAGVEGNGSPKFKDINGDGLVLADPGSALLPKTDFTSLGNGIPTWEFGWGNKLAFRNWDFNAFFRGAAGHSFVNVLRLGYETIDPGAINSFNRVKTDKAVPGLTGSQWSSLYVENASFLKLDNVTLGYTFPKKPGSWLGSLRIYGTVQNAFVITGYTGIDPEPNLVDGIPTSPTSPADPLAPGIDRNANYSPARTFLLGLALGIL